MSIETVTIIMFVCMGAAIFCASVLFVKTIIYLQESIETSSSCKTCTCSKNNSSIQG